MTSMLQDLGQNDVWRSNDADTIDITHVASEAERVEDHATPASASTSADGTFDDLWQEPAWSRSWGFFAFLACGLALMYVSSGPVEPPSSRVSDVTLPPAMWSNERKVRAAAFSPIANSEAAPTLRSSEVSAPVEVPRRARPTRSATHVAAISFASSSVVTSEKAIAAVVVLERSPPRKGALRVRWAARSGTADAAIDFSDASGTARFAEGQEQVGIYVPLRDDLLKETDESFQVCLDRENVPSGPPRCAVVTVRDDDSGSG